ncbi:hypothetical protein PIROE2DRAFT_18956 [Piromyces sp. E2]|nr:hypothetical protein PIROE2DRAFT_18956 [Piromyces sp. E2]|eukprot:OUM56442.1 hypothetical protein PIROE2DRAFT_18956 [Piromyces sp. E2]
MSSTNNSVKRDKEQATLITPPSATNPTKVIKLEIPKPEEVHVSATNLPSPMLWKDSPVSIFRENFMKHMEAWKQKNNLLTPSALNPLHEQGNRLEENQQILANSIQELKANAASKLEVDENKKEIILTQEEFLKMQQKEVEMMNTIEELKTRCTWLSDSLLEQRSSLEGKINSLNEQLGCKIDSLTEQLNNLSAIGSINQANQIVKCEEKITSLETKINLQEQIINKNEGLLNQCVELVNHQQQAIEFLLQKVEIVDKIGDWSSLTQSINNLTQKISFNNLGSGQSGQDITKLTAAIESLSSRIDTSHSGVTYDENNDVIMGNVGGVYRVISNIQPYSGDRKEAPQFVETVKKFFETTSLSDDQKNFFLSTHMGPEYNWYNFNKKDSVGNSRKAEEVLKLFEETFVRKLSIQEYTNLWLNLKFTWGKEYDYLDKFKYYLSYNHSTPFAIVQSVMMSQVPKEIGDELQKLEDTSSIQDLYDCVIKKKREREEKKRLEKSRGIESKNAYFEPNMPSSQRNNKNGSNTFPLDIPIPQNFIISEGWKVKTLNHTLLRMNKIESIQNCTEQHKISINIYDYNQQSWCDIAINSSFYVSDTIPKSIIIGSESINSLRISFKYNVNNVLSPCINDKNDIPSFQNCSTTAKTAQLNLKDSNKLITGNSNSLLSDIPFRELFDKPQQCYCFVTDAIPDEDDEDLLEDIEIKAILPEVYHSYISVFKQSSADSLPPHRPGLDCEITFKEGTVIRKSRNYPMNPKFKQLAEDYVTEMSDKGFIRESKSPIACPMVFQMKKDEISYPLTSDNE